MQARLDAVGLFDPTPFCDGFSTLISLVRGEWADAGYNVVATVILYGGHLANGGKYARKPAKQANRVGDAADNNTDDLAKAARATVTAKAISRAKPSLTTHQNALEQVHDAVGNLPKGKPGKFGQVVRHQTDANSTAVRLARGP